MFFDKLKIKKGDKAYIISGNDKGLVGEVLSRTKERIVISGVNVRKKHMKKSQDNQAGGIVNIERAIHISNVAMCVDDEKPRKLKTGFDKEGMRIYYYRDGDTEVTYRRVKEGNK